MPSWNETHASTLQRLGITIPEILLPKSGTDLSKWSIVACDQYTSDHAYWNQVEAIVGTAPSTLRLTLPEIYLERPDVASRIAKIHEAMAEYTARGILESQGEGLIYLQRTTEHSGTRQGLVVAVDLERYDYARDSKSLIRATEGTVVDRIPPRLAVRHSALLELPHIMILVDDPEHTVVEALEDRAAQFPVAYDVELIQKGGHLKGWKVQGQAVGDVLAKLDALLSKAISVQGERPLFWAMGDGNHSLATAKACWREIKNELQAAGESRESQFSHPARFALAEIVNIHSLGLFFEPIHRAVFTKDIPKLTKTALSEPTMKFSKICEEDLAKLLVSPRGQDKAGYFDGKTWYLLAYSQGKQLPTAWVDELFGRFQKSVPGARIDFIHGWENAKKLVTEGAGVFFTPVIARERLFQWVQENGPLPKKSFSLGHAEEKRNYLEARRIVR
jgi:anti-sigma factor ChrR (cupin superfamily)